MGRKFYTSLNVDGLGQNNTSCNSDSCYNTNTNQNSDTGIAIIFFDFRRL